MNRLFKYFRYEYIIVNIELTISIMSLLKNHNSFKNYKKLLNIIKKLCFFYLNLICKSFSLNLDLIIFLYILIFIYNR